MSPEEAAAIAETQKPFFGANAEATTNSPLPDPDALVGDDIAYTTIDRLDAPPPDSGDTSEEAVTGFPPDESIDEPFAGATAEASAESGIDWHDLLRGTDENPWGTPADGASDPFAGATAEASTSTEPPDWYTPSDRPDPFAGATAEASTSTEPPDWYTPSDQPDPFAGATAEASTSTEPPDWYTPSDPPLEGHDPAEDFALGDSVDLRSAEAPNVGNE
jgi:hypothetical protein